MRYMGEREERKNRIENFTFWSHIKCCHCHTISEKKERISILPLDHYKCQSPFFRGEKIHTFFQEKGSESMIKFESTKACIEKSFNRDSMYCANNPTERPTNRAQKWNSNQKRKFTTKNQNRILQYTVWVGYRIHSMTQ